MSDGKNNPSKLQTMEYILKQLLEYEASLRKKESTLRKKIEDENNAMEKIAMRRDFYKKMESNMAPKRAEATSKLEAAEAAMGNVQNEMANTESQKKKLEAALADVIAQNQLDVLPELERLSKLLATSKEEVKIAKIACSNDEQRVLELTKMAETYEAEIKDIQSTINARSTALASIPRPESLANELTAIENSTKEIQIETDEVEGQKKKVAAEIELHIERKNELEKQKTVDQRKLEVEFKRLEDKRKEADDHVKALGEERVKQHSLASLRLEIEMNTAAVQDGIKHDSNFLTVDNRTVNTAKSSLIKKKQATAKTKELIPQTKAKISDLQRQLSIAQAEKSSLEEEKSSMLSKVDLSMVKFLEQEELDESQQRQLDKTMQLVASKECEIEQWQTDEKRASTILALMIEKRKFAQRKIEQAEQMKSDIEDAIRLQQLINIDINKKSKDAEAKVNEFSTLRGMIESEKLETTRTIQFTNEALAEMKIKCDELQRELRRLTAERDTKLDTLRLIRKDIDASTENRAIERRDKSNVSSSCRVTLAEISNEEARIEKLQATLTLTRKEVERMELQNKQLMDTKNSLAEQLAAKKAQLTSLFGSNAAYSETLKKGELICQQLEEEKKMTDLKNNDIKRSINILKSGAQDHAALAEKIERAKKNLELQILETERISAALESPNQDRIRTLEGHDPSEEELRQNLSVLESLERNNREVLRNKGTAIKEITQRCEELQEESANWKASTQSHLNNLNDYQSRLHDLQRVRTAQLSELQMYAELVEKLNASKVDLQHDISLRGQLISRPEREVTPTYSPPPTTKHVVEQRPTAYLPAGDEDEIIKVPRPFGGMAPFQPTVPGSTMRHIRKPQPVPLLSP